MIDLTPEFRIAFGRRGQWSTSLAQDSLDAIARCARGVVDWEPGDEEWGRVLVDQEVAALVHSRWPLALVVAPMVPQPPALGPEIILMSIGSIESQDYRIDRAWLQSAVGRKLTENVDYEHIAVGELWWATVS